MLRKYTEFFENHYKRLLIIPILVLLLSIAYLAYHGVSTGSIVNKGISLKGGTAYLIGVNGIIGNTTMNGANSANGANGANSTDISKLELLDVDILEKRIKDSFPDIDVSIRKMVPGTQILLEFTGADPEEVKKWLVDNGYSIYSTEVIGSVLGEEFFKQFIRAIIISFVLMSIIVFIYFRAFAPAGAVVLSAFSDIVIVVAIITLLGIKINTSGIAALLMLIGYSVDTDILLSTRFLRKDKKTISERLYLAMKTGLTMTLTTFGAVLVAYFFANASAIKEIMFIILIGLVVDLMNTWIQNASIITIYVKKKMRI